MMDIREKLVELLGNIYLPMMDGHNTIGEYNIPHKFKEKIADGLISKGVTVQEWISVKNRLPDNKEHDWVLAQVVEDNGYMHIPRVMEYRQAKDDWFEETYGWLSEHNGLFSVTHWMPLPNSPKGDKYMDNYELTPNTTTLENSYDEHIIKVEITFIGEEPKSTEEIKKLLGADHVLIKSTKVFHHKRRNRRK